MSDMATEKKTGKAKRGNAMIAVACIAFVGAMIGVSYAAVPLYQLFCQVTGYGGTTQRAETAPAEPIDRKITVRFDANVGAGLDWALKPNERTITLQVGAVGETAYTARNLTGETSWGTATFNVTPFEAGPYFSKIDCFCFTEQELKGGETAEMGITFYVDPDIAEDPNLDHIKNITLSYTMFPAEAPEPKPFAARDAGDSEERDDNS